MMFESLFSILDVLMAVALAFVYLIIFRILHSKIEIPGLLFRLWRIGLRFQNFHKPHSFPIKVSDNSYLRVRSKFGFLKPIRNDLFSFIWCFFDRVASHIESFNS